ncbi:MAG: hypothetical protein RL648_731, partial [Verrucomicrobiota bacterium]
DTVVSMAEANINELIEFIKTHQL